MTKIFAFIRPKAPISSQDQEIWNELRRALREQYSNPQRTGCPEAEVLERLARQKLRLQEAEKWLDHFSRCSPCFCDFEKLQSRVKQKRKLFWGGAAAAVIALCSALALWLTYDRSAKEHTLAQIQPSPVDLHFEDAASNRETGNEPEGNFQHLANRAISLSIYLPPGSEAGRYEIALRRTLTDSVPQAKFEGTAEIEDNIAVLRTSPDLSGLQPGTYILAFRPVEGRWRYFHVMVP